MKNNNFFKSGLAVIAVLISAVFTAQTTIIVDNNSTNPVTQSNLQTAIDNATSGDIIYVQPSPTSYGDINITKAITLIGGSSNEDGFVSTLGTIYLEDGSSNSQFKGLTFSSTYQNTAYQTGVSVANIGIKECKGNIDFGDPSPSSSIAPNWIIEGNIINNISGNYGVENLVLKNNIIQSLTFVSVNNGIITQNIFPNSSSIYYYDYDNMGPITISNSIFIGNTAMGSADAYIYGKVDFQDCLSYDYGGTGFTFTEDSSDGYSTVFTDMMYNQNPLFTNINTNSPADPTEYSIANGNSFNPNLDDLQLQASSPAIGAGASGEDYGIYYNYNFNALGNPVGIPKVRITSIPASVPAGNNLQVTITAEAQ